MITVPLLPRIKLACPYCYNTFPEWRIEFRCSGLPGLSGERCDPEPDERLKRHFGTTGDRPHTFPGRWHRYRSKCPMSRAKTNTRVCPICHSTLPVHFGRIPSQLIALVGAKDSGKTVFMTVFMHEFDHRLGERLRASVAGADDETRRRFPRDYEQRLYDGGSLPNPTNPETERQGYRAPMVFRFKRQAEQPGPHRTRQTLLSFFDTAGEDLTTKKSTELNARYLKAADAVILILDPLQTPGGRRLAASEALPENPGPGENPDNPGQKDDPYSVLLRITEMLQAGHRPRRVRKPLAVVFTKLDALWRDFPDGSALKRPEPAGPGCDERDGRDVHRHVQALLHDWDGRRIDQYLQHSYRRFRYFAVSALGAIPIPDERASAPRKRVSAVIQPYRVADPILWLLSRARMVPVIRGSRAHLPVIRGH